MEKLCGQRGASLMMLLSALYTLTSLRGSSSVSLASAHDECSCLLFQLNATWPLSPASAPCLGSLSGEAGVSCGGEVRHWCVCLFVCVRVCVCSCMYMGGQNNRNSVWWSLRSLPALRHLLFVLYTCMCVGPCSVWLCAVSVWSLEVLKQRVCVACWLWFVWLSVCDSACVCVCLSMHPLVERARPYKCLLLTLHAMLSNEMFTRESNMFARRPSSRPLNLVIFL